MSVTAYIDESGIHAPTYEECLNWFKDQWRAVFGTDLYLENDSQEGQLASILALAVYDTNQMAIATYNSLSPQTAVGIGLSQNVKLNGLIRKSATRSTVDVRIVGTAGTTIVNGVITDMANNKWNLPSTVVIPPSSEITVTAIAAESGALNAQIGEVCNIFTPTRGWQSVTNLVASTPGNSVETDYELRVRQAESTAMPALSVFEASVAAIRALSGVSKIKAYENFTDEVDSNGIPAHSLCFVVLGGDVQSIGEMILKKKSPGCGLYGTTSVTVYDDLGNSCIASFYRPTPVVANIGISVTVKPTYDAQMQGTIESNLTTYIDSLGISDPLKLNKLFRPIYEAGDNFDITDITINSGTSDLVVAFNELVEVGTITFTINNP